MISEIDEDMWDFFIVRVSGAIPRQRFYPKRPDLLYKMSNQEFKMRFRLNKETVVVLAEILDGRLKPKNNRSQSFSTVNQILFSLRLVWLSVYFKIFLF